MRVPLLTVALISVAASSLLRGDDIRPTAIPPSPTILSRFIAAAEHFGPPLRSESNTLNGVQDTYYLHQAEYVGYCTAPFGRVIIALLHFIRSGGPGDTQIPHGATYLVFADAPLRVRAFWALDRPLKLSVSGSMLLVGTQIVLDFRAPTKDGIVLLDGKPQVIPEWRKGA